MSTCAVCELHAESTFRVEGMDCHEEVAILERRLSRLSGLEALDADVLGQRLRIKYDAARLSTDAIAEAVAQTGMRAWLEHEQPAAPRGDWRRHLVVGSGVLFAAGLAAAVFGARVPAWPPARSCPSSLGGVPTARRALASVRARHLDIHVLMIVAVIGAVILGEWTEAASVVFLFALAQLLEAARDGAGARRDSRADGTGSGRRARSPRTDGRSAFPSTTCAVGDIGAGRAGREDPARRPGAAGRVTSTRRRSRANRCRPRRQPATMCSPARSTAAARSTSRSRGCARDSTLARIIHLVERAQAQRAPSQTFVDRFARIYTPIVLALAVAGRGRAAAAVRRRRGASGSIARSCCWSSRARARS